MLVRTLYFLWKKTAVSSICAERRAAAPGVVSSAGTQKTPLCPGELSSLICVGFVLSPALILEEKKRVFNLNTLNSEEQKRYIVWEEVGKSERTLKGNSLHIIMTDSLPPFWKWLQSVEILLLTLSNTAKTHSERENERNRNPKMKIYATHAMHIMHYYSAVTCFLL